MKIVSFATLILSSFWTMNSAALRVEDIDIPASFEFFKLMSDDVTLSSRATKGAAEASVTSSFVSMIQAKGESEKVGPFGVTFSDGQEQVLPVTKVFRTTDEHLDYEQAPAPGQARASAEGTVALFSLEDHEGAHFEAEETCVPIQKNRLILFDGGQSLHRTVIRSHEAGKKVMFIGPILAKSLMRVGNVDIPTYSPTKSKAVKMPKAGKTMKPSTSPSTMFPTDNPTPNPTDDPTSEPTMYPTMNPTTAFPTENPTLNPTFDPTLDPTMYPTMNPTMATPTENPTANPTMYPTSNPSSRPSKAGKKRI